MIPVFNLRQQRFLAALVCVGLLASCSDTENASTPKDDATPAPVPAPTPAPAPVAATPAPAPAPAPAPVVPAEPPVVVTLFDFDNGTQGWWNYGHNATLAITKDSGGAHGSAGCFEATFKPGSAGFYYGIGNNIPDMPSLPSAKLSGGHLMISAKSDADCDLRIDIQTVDGGGYSTSISHIPATWTLYEIPLSSFSGGGKSLDQATAKFKAFNMAPGTRRGDADSHVWLDDIGFSTGPVTLPTTSYDISGHASDAAGAAAAGALVSVHLVGDDVEIWHGTTAADGSYAGTAQYALSKYQSTPLDTAAAAPTDAASTSAAPAKKLGAEIVTTKDGYLTSLTPAVLAPGANQADVVIRQASPAPEPLTVVGNRLHDGHDQEVWLQGLCIDSLEWSAGGDRMLHSVPIAIDGWHANCVRLPVHQDFWFGRGGHGQTQSDGGDSYRKLVDKIVDECTQRGAYLVLDLHAFGAPMPEHVEFWKDAAARYQNNPTVIFELFNEPHDIPWPVWRNGGSLAAGHDDQQVIQNTIKNSGDHSVGMQALVDAVRGTGAMNLIAAGGLGWSYDLSGVVNGYALTDVPGGHGIMYVWHTYPWSHYGMGWQKSVLDAAARFPIFVTEVGNIHRWEDFSFIGKDQQKCEDITTLAWAHDILGLIQQNKLNWTGFSFHPTCGPSVISDWTYTPTSYWGVFVKQALAGQPFVLARLR